MITLGIETSCDETACALVQDGRLLSNIVSSSVPLHAKYGGVIPEIASRYHIEYINKVVREALKKAKKQIRNLDLIAVSKNPGLPGSLIAGVSFAKALSYSLEVPLVDVNHVHAHIFSNFLTAPKADMQFPFIGVVVSGGHTNIFVVRSFEELELVGRTRDDAIGEAFDKVAKILGIGYPGGPKIEKYAKRFNGKGAIKFPKAFLGHDSLDFSMSGIKTAVLYYARTKKLSAFEISRISWSFQEAVFEMLIENIVKAVKKFNIKTLLLGGGVLANKELRAKLARACKKMCCNLSYPPPELCVDNAAMVAGLGENIFKRGRLK
ncbi:MAG: tRNA (adenosine(37)-N6)-threonylcarbamoyltransferase complex transferase subunit TsaD [Candidatus Omnitrophota bacterium]